MAVTWRTTKGVRNLDYRCDAPGCTAMGNTIHFVPWVTECEAVLFACPDHDPGGYWTELERWFDPSERFPQHVAGKPGSEHALSLLDARIDALRRVGAK